MCARDRVLQAADRALQPDVRASDQACRADRPERSGGSTWASRPSVRSHAVRMSTNVRRERSVVLLQKDEAGM
jgi:hypothetical protein